MLSWFQAKNVDSDQMIENTLHATTVPPLSQNSFKMTELQCWRHLGWNVPRFEPDTNRDKLFASLCVTQEITDHVRQTSLLLLRPHPWRGCPGRDLWGLIPHSHAHHTGIQTWLNQFEWARSVFWNFLSGYDLNNAFKHDKHLFTSGYTKFWMLDLLIWGRIGNTLVLVSSIKQIIARTRTTVALKCPVTLPSYWAMISIPGVSSISTFISCGSKADSSEIRILA